MRLERDGGEYFLRTVSEEPEVSDGVAITLLIGLLKSSQFDVVLSGASELGIKRIIPALCERSIPRIEPAERAKKLARWRKILDEGTSVSGSIFPTAIDSLCAFSEIDWNLMPDARYAAVISRDSRPISEARAYGVEVAFAVGPEGDWSDSETCVLMEHGFIPVTLGNRIMKASTAVIAGCGWFRLSCF
jgi:16S rRNA (uracil1498-N3)-methyltransferase